MNPTRLFRRLTAVAAVALAATALLMGCSSEPDDIAFDNPFDPSAPGSDDPFHVTATYLGGQVIVQWTHLEGYDIASYTVQRFTDPAGWTTVATGILATQASEMSVFDPDPVPLTANSYMVIGVDSEGSSPETSHLVPATVHVPPVITNAADTTAVFSRWQDLVVHADGADHVELDVSDEFTTAITAPIVDGTAAFGGYDLGAADALGETKTLYTRAVTLVGADQTPAYSSVGRTDFKVRFAPDIELAGGGAVVAERQVDLTVTQEAEGATRMRFALSLGALDAEPWLDAAPQLTGFTLDDEVNRQTIYADFEGDFGYVHRDSLTVTPATLGEADFTLPDGTVVGGPVIRLETSAEGAGEMRIGLADGWDAAVWEPLQETVDVTLPDDLEPGVHVLNVRFRNPWNESPLRSALLVVGASDLQVAFSYPLAGAIVEGGAGIELVGFATGAPAGDPVNSVQVELLGEWQDAVGTDTWETFWNVPTVAEDQELTVRARAFTLSGLESATALLTVTVSNLRVAITEPLDDAIVMSGESVTVAGTAGPYLAGAALDSVVVTTGEERLRVDGALEEWSLDWEAPTVTESTSVDLTAWAFAGGDSTGHEITVSVEPAE